MKEYKIKVADEVESKEAQELFFELGYGWADKNNIPVCTKYLYLYGYEDGTLSYDTNAMLFKHEDNQEITLPQLRDLAVLHRNDVGDATHVGRSGSSYYCGEKIYFFDGMKWVERNISLNEIEPITKKPQMTWQDALRAVADGKEVEFRGYTGEWEEVIHLALHNVVGSDFIFRLAPQRKELNGNFTKEELLKIAGEME